jgi:hypothetical protein
MAYSVIGIFLKLADNQHNPKFHEFSQKISNLPDLFMGPFLNLHAIVINQNFDKELLFGIERYKETVELFESQRLHKRDRKMSVTKI